MSRTAKDRARVGIQTACHYGCGEIVVAFTTEEMAGTTQVSAANVSITADLSDEDIRHRLWEYRGQQLGWVLLWPGTEGGPVRSWRPLRVEHDCPATPAHRKPPRRDPAIST